MICRYYVWMDEYLSVCYVLLLFVQEGLAPMNYDQLSDLAHNVSNTRKESQLVS